MYPNIAPYGIIVVVYGVMLNTLSCQRPNIDEHSYNIQLFVYFPVEYNSIIFVFVELYSRYSER